MTHVSIATWNVNSIKARMPHLLQWLRDDKPDIALLQETKCTDENFPRMEIEELGYNIAFYGEKSYNGVAILSKFPIDDIKRGWPGNEDDLHTRYIEAVVSLPGSAIRVASIYVPNGSTPDDAKFQHKQRFLDRFSGYAKSLLLLDEPIIIGGDYNIAPASIDVHNTRAWEGTVLTHDEVRSRFRRLLNSGYYDAFRLLHDEPGYSWWDYRAGAFDSDNGLRIDHLLISAQAADSLNACEVHKHLRALEKASDHAPVIARFDFIPPKR